MTVIHRAEALERLQRIANDPQRGDKVCNRTIAHHPTRRVTDRTLGSDVCYCWHENPRYYGKCSLGEWQQFCAGARVLAISDTGLAAAPKVSEIR